MSNSEIIDLLTQYQTHILKLGSQTRYNYQETRSFLNKNRAVVQKILVAARVLPSIDITPPPLTGGYIQRNVNPLDIMFDPPYGVNIYSIISDVIEQAIGVIEADPTFSTRIDQSSSCSKDYDIWALIHPSIAEVSKKRIKDGYYADAVEAACKVLNSRVREIVKDQIGEELDGAGLMRKALSPANPIIQISSAASRSGRDTQQGYMDIFAGVMTGIRNPKAHENESIKKEDALRKLIMISLLMFKVDERIILD